jgi:acyl carrier protein
MDLYAEIREMIIRELALDEERVVSEAHLQDDLGADSLALLNLAENIAKQYDVEMEGDDLVDIENVDGLVRLVESRISSKS